MLLTAIQLQSSNPFLFKQHKRLSSEIFDVLILRESMDRRITPGEKIFNNSCRRTSVTQQKRSQNYTNNKSLMGALRTSE